MITHEEIRSIALLAKLEVPDEELDALTQEMEKIIAFADTVSHAPVSDTGFDNIHHLENGFRPDVVTPSLPQEEILQNAVHQENGCFSCRTESEGTRNGAKSNSVSRFAVAPPGTILSGAYPYVSACH